MLRTLSRGTAAAALLLTAGLTAASAQVPQPVPATGAAPSGKTFRAKEVLGTKVHIAGNVAVGTVDDLVFDDAGNLDYMIVLNEGKLVTLPWEAATFDFQKRTAVVNITAERFRVIPTYTVQTYPSFYTPAYRTEIYTHYGLTPRELRRIERGVPPIRKP
ncbi:MAG TPA: PRC-barrel domain-containing protein [Gemmataceae bacterium]|nr:PRC-barrel domain-containing protein [Gemmataceae bacterium]